MSQVSDRGMHVVCGKTREGASERENICGAVWLCVHEHVLLHVRPSLFVVFTRTPSACTSVSVCSLFHAVLCGERCWLRRFLLLCSFTNVLLWLPLLVSHRLHSCVFTGVRAHAHVLRVLVCVLGFLTGYVHVLDGDRERWSE